METDDAWLRWFLEIEALARQFPLDLSFLEKIQDTDDKREILDRFLLEVSIGTEPMVLAWLSTGTWPEEANQETSRIGIGLRVHWALTILHGMAGMGVAESVPKEREAAMDALLVDSWGGAGAAAIREILGQAGRYVTPRPSPGDTRRQWGRN